MQKPAVDTEPLGISEAFLAFQERISRVAPIDRPVLVLGERGTGKELAAARLHYLSRRWEGPFLALNCAALTPTLLETELFGHEKGAFTGADRMRQGRFEAADTGTLFLDEIGAAPLPVQEKILRVVEYGSFERVGGNRPVETDVRIIGATNADLRELAGSGKFKEDLLDRLSFDVLHAPPLRARIGDVLFLANHVARRMAFELGREQIPAFSRGVEKALESHPWPGNIRELKNVVERAVYQSAQDEITFVVFDPFISPYAPPGRPAPPEPPEPDEAAKDPRPQKLPDKPLLQAIEDLTVDMVSSALFSARHNRKKAAERLGLSYDQLRHLLKKHGDRLKS